MSDPRILVIEDETPIRRFLRIAVESAGFTLIEADRAGSVSKRPPPRRPTSSCSILACPISTASR